MNKPKVSVIVPVYNTELYLRECLDSILGQTLKEIEVICINAGSTDASCDILREYERRDSRLTIYTGKGRLDAGTARNIGLSMAKGEYLSFLDSDDYFKAEMLQDTYKKAETEKADIVVFSAQKHDMRTDIISEMPESLRRENCPKRSTFSPKDMSKYIFNSFQNWTWNKLFRTEFIKNNKITFQAIARTNDMAFTCEALALAERISILPNTYTTYRIGTGTSLQQTNDQSPTCFWDAYKETRNRLISDGVYEIYKQSFINTVLSGALYNMRSVKSDEAYREIQYLLKFESDEFEFDIHKKKYFYDEMLYKKYRKLKSKVKKIDNAILNPKVSVVLPCLNSRMYIRECIESIMQQELTNIEIIVVDAGSTDGTVEVLEQYVEKDSRIKIIHSDKKSYGYQMNLGLKAAKGEYFAIVESDDFIKPSMYAELCEIADKNELEVLKADYKFFTGDHKKRDYKYRSILPFAELYNQVLDPENEPRVFRNYVVSWCGIYKTSFLKQNEIFHNESPGASFQDNGFWFQIFTQAHRVMFYDKPYYMLRRDNPGSSIYATSKAYCMFGEYDFIRNFLAKKPELEKKYAPLCAYKRFKNYIWANENLVADENRKEYITRFSQEFIKILDAGEIDPSLYSVQEYNTLMTIINIPDDYYNECMLQRTSRPEFIGPLTKDAHIQRLIEENELLKQKNERKKKSIAKKNTEIKNLKNSKSYRIGRFVTYIPRLVRGGILCIEDHGLIYTLKYSVKKIIRKLKKFLF